MSSTLYKPAADAVGLDSGLRFVRHDQASAFARLRVARSG